MVWHDMACLIDCVGTYDKTKIIVGMLDNDDGGLSTSLLNLLSCPCQSVPTWIIITLFFEVYIYNWVMLLIVLYDGVILVRKT